MAAKWRSKIGAKAVGSPSERARQSTSDGTCSITLTVPEAAVSLSAWVLRLSPLPAGLRASRLSMAEDAARELPSLSLEEALQLVHLYADRGSPKFERAALRRLERYLAEGSPTLRQVADVTATFAQLGRRH